MSNEERLVGELVKNALYRIDESSAMVQKCLVEITEEELWLQPNESLNSIANLIVHLCGNITQYIISSLGETDDNRNRSLEFSVRDGASKAALLDTLEHTIEKAKGVILDAKLHQLLKIRDVQGFSLSGVGVIIHVVEHYSYHTGQIAFWVKQLKNKDLGFFDGIDLNINNRE